MEKLSDPGILEDDVLARAVLSFALLCSPAIAVAGDAGAGGEVYKRYCRGCHGKDGRGGAHTFMPHIHNLTRKGYIDLRPDGVLEQIIREGGEPYGMSSYMPAWEGTLDDKQIDDVIAYIRTLPLH
ncbi:MAG: cytochrome c [Pseudomonadota bacterium]